MLITTATAIKLPKRPFISFSSLNLEFVNYIRTKF
jgi:hypothetical protein